MTVAHFRSMVIAHKNSMYIVHVLWYSRMGVLFIEVHVVLSICVQLILEEFRSAFHHVLLLINSL